MHLCHRELQLNKQEKYAQGGAHPCVCVEAGENLRLWIAFPVYGRKFWGHWRTYNNVPAAISVPVTALAAIFAVVTAPPASCVVPTAPVEGEDNMTGECNCILLLLNKHNFMVRHNSPTSILGGRGCVCVGGGGGGGGGFGGFKSQTKQNPK